MYGIRDDRRANGVYEEDYIIQPISVQFQHSVFCIVANWLQGSSENGKANRYEKGRVLGKENWRKMFLYASRFALMIQPVVQRIWGKSINKVVYSILQFHFILSALLYIIIISKNTIDRNQALG